MFLGRQTEILHHIAIVYKILLLHLLSTFTKIGLVAIWFDEKNVLCAFSFKQSTAADITVCNSVTDKSLGF